MNNPTLANIVEANAKVARAMEQVASATDLDTDSARTVAHARVRMQEARMLLGLAEGVPHKIHPGLQLLHQAIVNADKTARALLNADVALDGMTEEQVGSYQEMLEMAEMAYHQWRVNSTLALMHLSTALDTVKKEGQ